MPSAASPSRLESGLADASLAGRLDGVAVRLAPDRFRFRSPHGSVSWARVARPDGTWRFETEEVTGTDLLALHDTTRLRSLTDERAAYTARPLAAVAHGRPFAYESLSQLFDDAKVPSLLLAPAAGFPTHGNTGNHGALTSVQCRGLLLAAGPGVRRGGWLDAHARITDIAPTLLALLGLPVVDGRGPSGDARPGCRLLAQDGDEIGALLDPSSGPARHVVAVVFDGCNTNLLADAVEAGELPHVAALLARGAGLRNGTVASFPTVTLPNHTTAFTGVHPGRHGVVNNDFLSVEGRYVNLLDFASMTHTCDWIAADVETVHDAVHRARPDAFTSAMYEYADRGADWSTFGEFRARRRPFYASAAAAVAASTAWASESDEHYRFQSRIDESALGAAVEQWRGPSVTGHPLPTLQLVNLSLTDAAGHASGPHGALARAALIDSDARLGRLLAAVDAAGELEHTAFVLCSDHGMEQCDPELLERHPHTDLDPLVAPLGHRVVGDVLLHPA